MRRLWKVLRDAGRFALGSLLLIGLVAAVVSLAQQARKDSPQASPADVGISAAAATTDEWVKVVCESRHLSSYYRSSSINGLSMLFNVKKKLACEDEAKNVCYNLGVTDTTLTWNFFELDRSTMVIRVQNGGEDGLCRKYTYAPQL